MLETSIENAQYSEFVIERNRVQMSTNLIGVRTRIGG